VNGSACSGNDVGLEAVDLKADLPLLECWLRRPHVMKWWGAQDASALAQRSRETDAVVTSHGEPVGYLCWQTLSASERAEAGLTDLPDDLVDIDILIGEPEFLGRGVGPRALVLLLAKLRREGVGFAGLGTSASNRAALRAFEKAGFRPFRDFEDPEFGPCTYMVAQLRAPVARPVGADGAARHSDEMSGTV
jgi:aminoglycoside 6'-N-acetyltransferase